MSYFLSIVDTDDLVFNTKASVVTVPSNTHVSRVDSTMAISAYLMWTRPN